MEQLLGSTQNDEPKDSNTAATPTSSIYHHSAESPTFSTSSPVHSSHSSPRSLHETMDNGEWSTDSHKAPKGKVMRYLGSSSGLYLVNDILKNKEQDNIEDGDGTSYVAAPSSSPSPSTSTGGSIGNHVGTSASVGATLTTIPSVPGTSSSHSSLHGTPSNTALPMPSTSSSSSTTTTNTTKAHNDDDNFTSLQTRQGTVRMRRMNGYDDDLMMVREETEDETRIQAIAANEQEIMDSIIPRSMLANLVNIYFQTQSKTLPILDKDEFINSFEGKTHPPPAPLLTYAICSYACFLVPSDHPIFVQSDLERNQIFSALVDRAGMFIRSEYLVPRIQTIQALILLCAHPTYSSGSYRNWLLAGMAVRMAQDLALHRSVTNNSGTTVGDVELNEKRRRLWYSVYVTDRWCCSVMGRPLAIADSDCDVDLPSIDTLDQPGKYALFVNLVKLSGILGEVLRRIYSPKAKAMGYGTHIMEQTVWSLDKMLKEWFDHVPSECLITQDELRGMKGIERTQEPRFRSGGPLTVCYYAVVVLLFRPFIVSESGNQTSKLFNDAPRRCMEAAKNAIDVARYIPEGEINRFGWNFAAYSVFQAALIHVYNCTSNDPVVAQNSRDYIRISIDECMAPITKDIPFGPPAIQFLENLLHLMKADPSSMRHTTSNGTSSSEQPHYSASYHSTSTNGSTTSTDQSTTTHRPSFPPTSSRFIPTSSPSASDSYSRSTLPLQQQQQQTMPSASPMSVYQIVTGMEQPSLSSASTIPPSNSINKNGNKTGDLSSSLPTNVDYASNPMDLITLALTQDSLLGNQDNPMMTQATWKYLFSSAGTPFTNNANSGSEFQVSWENMFMDGQGNQNS
ncbi:fungal-specific transcription factor domain-containing protein [Chlamydoabsidia padenii]|nr:fungal-specific transcription factor domain-containing protein [Chlamydoabsidia padenii]